MSYEYLDNPRLSKLIQRKEWGGFKSEVPLTVKVGEKVLFKGTVGDIRAWMFDREVIHTDGETVYLLPKITKVLIDPPRVLFDSDVEGAPLEELRGIIKLKLRVIGWVEGEFIQKRHKTRKDWEEYRSLRSEINWLEEQVRVIEEALKTRWQEESDTSVDDLFTELREEADRG